MQKLLVMIVVIACFLVFFANASNSNTGKFANLKGAYLGQKPPGIEPVLFAPGIVSTGMFERDVVIAMNGKEFYYGLMFGTQATIMVSRQKDGIWSEPEIVSFASDMKYYYFEPSITNDGKRMFFLSTLPPAGKEPKPGWSYQNIWAVDRLENGVWGKPYELDTPINSDEHNFYPSVTNDSTLYFTRATAKDFKTTIYRSRLKEGKYTEIEKLPAPVNGKGTLYNAFIAHDESYLIVCAADLPKNDTGVPQYYIYFRDENDKWSEPINMGEKINKPGATASSAYVSPDGKYLFFASTWKKPPEQPLAGTLSLSKLLQIYMEPQNGNSDIYWVDAGIIQKLKEIK